MSRRLLYLLQMRGARTETSFNRVLGVCPVSTHPSIARYSTVSSEGSSTSESTFSRQQYKARIRLYSVACGSLCALIGSSYILYQQMKARADEGKEEEEKESKDGERSKEGEEEEGEKKDRVSFHDRSVMAYEDRIRAYSTPDKIFRYFATLRIKEEDGSRNIYMTPQDFIRAITPGTMQPQEYGLDLYRTVTIETIEKEGLGRMEDSNSVFNKLGQHGLISFSDFLFLLTILATPMKHFELAFKMFDLNGDGEVEFDEFETVQSVLLSSTAMGVRHRDHVINGNVASSVGGALAVHFFGKKLDQKLTIEKFQEFHTLLNTEILLMEYLRYDLVDGMISERDFAHMILRHASLSEQKKKQMVKRVKKKFGPKPNPVRKVVLLN
ncbi:PREDICTED: calcium uptake protein 1, mitochondrial-like [Amphimedon queenslandica]|uniref:EF-hand domain-containing protein n=1 Tax=Amphimedon queenslandica TaxID=400682 RepID=A0AAN0J4K6_AMPQE|nr:PREDICTED: calcium uptake protein 1, mitochondrial-like [Amphimedon queenslandica]|eukprot:XP_019851682.1 PREDICTED: calcium uptake protein 1, mitochondrial-like [Amphimedon queenslandica]